MSIFQGVGAPVWRKEDRRFLTGAGCYTDDLPVHGQAHAVVLRSPHPHARIGGIDTRAALAMPGVLTVLTGADIEDRVKPIPSLTRTEPFKFLNRDASLMPEPDQPVLAIAKVRYPGEPVALVVAETVMQAHDAAEAIEVDYQPLPALSTLHSATAAGATAIWDTCPGNVAFDWARGDEAATAAALADAHRVTRVELVNNRIAPVFMEPRSAMAEYDPIADRLTLHAGSQSAHRLQVLLTDMLGLDTAQLRVVTPDTGGGFGARGGVYPEFALVLFAARRLGRPVRWTAERGESFLTDTQARDHVLRASLAIDAEGRFTALDVKIDWRHGAYVPSRGIWVMIRFLTPTIGGVYTIPTGHVGIRGVFTNSAPMTAYRGVGRMEVTYLMERLVDAAAREIGIDRLELRRRNMVTDEHLPWAAVGGASYEACTFAPHLERAVAHADWAGFAARRQESRSRGQLRGIGLSVYVENDGGAPAEYAEVSAEKEGRVIARIGTQDFGMGHATVYAQVLSDRLGVPFEAIELINGDTDEVARGSGSHGSRSMRVGGSAAVAGADRMIEHGKHLAAEMLEASAADLAYSDCRFVIAGTDRSATLFEVAAFAASRNERLAGEADFDPGRESYSSGCHVCEVEIDPETGRVKLLTHVMITDVGKAVNPMIVEGQIHGGAAQGLGQAAMEEVVYDAESGQLLTGSLMDYTLPRADDLPMFVTELAETRETDNPLGVKGVGEGATTGSPAAYMNAVRDALNDAGAADVDMPATAERIWRVLREARAC